MDYDTTLVCGAVLPGHDYQHHHRRYDDIDDDIDHRSPSTSSIRTPTTTILNGRTSPWNTFALWNINKLSKIGFVTVSDGLHIDMNPTGIQTKSIAGIEEVVTIALLQKLYDPHTEMMAKLISLSHPAETNSTNDSATTSMLQWDTSSTTTTDIGRQQWHEYKMQSKLQRAHAQLQLLSLLPSTTDDDDDVSSSRPGIVYQY